MVRIERSTNGQVVFTLSGRMQTEHIAQIQKLLVVEPPAQRVLFNLRDVTLINQEVVIFLADCEESGIKIEKCPLHIRTWIDRKKRLNKKRPKQIEDAK